MRIGSVLKHSGQAVLEGALIAMLVVGLVAGTAFAARGGGGKPGGGDTTSSATVTVNPNTVDVGAWYTVSGCGYKAGAPLDIKLFTSSATVILFTGGDAAGCFNLDNQTWDASAVRVEAWQYTGRWSLKARTTFTVQ
jgi:hypothetical protein